MKTAKANYHAQMAAAANGRGPLPPVKTFGANPYSTNTVQKDLQAAEDWRYVSPNTDIADLTWEQKGTLGLNYSGCDWPVSKTNIGYSPLIG